MLAPLNESVLPHGIRSRFVAGVNGLTVHVLEAGFETPDRPLVLLIHGFPELAFSWRKLLLPLAEAGFHVVAPDQRGYGRTTGWDADFDDDVAPFRLLNLVRDALGLVSALGYRRASVVGHDVGSVVAAWCALIRPDVFSSVALMSAPFGGPRHYPSTPTRRRGRLRLAMTSTQTWPLSTRPASTTNGTSPPGKRNRTSWTVRRGCMTFSAPITT